MGSKHVRGWSAVLALAAAGCTGGDPNDLAKLRQVLTTNAEVAHAAYADSVTTAEALRVAIEALIASPGPATLAAARTAWRVAREPYGQTEVFRFRHSPIDDTNYDPADGEDGPEGAINAWPLGEALIDYVVAGDDFGPDQLGVTSHQTGVAGAIPPANIINSTGITIDAALLSASATAEDERDVIAGYHAIEFLLWGQDLNADGSADTDGRRDATPGQRPHTDFAQDASCTSGPTVNGSPTLCARRAAYLRVAADALVAHLTAVRDAWAPGSSYRTAFTEVAGLPQAKEKLVEILTGMGTLSEGELAGERMQIALSASSQEDEHSCFSDNTHRDLHLNAEGVAGVYFGRYPGYDSTLDGTADATGRAVSGYGLDAYLRDVGRTALADQLVAALAATATHTLAIDAAARGGKPVDVLIQQPAGADARPMRDAIVSLNAQSVLVSRVATELSLGNVEVVDPDASACDTTDPTSGC